MLKFSGRNAFHYYDKGNNHLSNDVTVELRIVSIYSVTWLNYNGILNMYSIITGIIYDYWTY